MRTLFRGGRVYSPADPAATALLVDGETVQWVGRDPAEVAEPSTVVELAGALVAPAFVDAHVHTTAAGLAITGLDLSTVDSVVALLDAVAGHARRAGRPVLGHGWDQTGWPEGRPPTRAELDRAGDGAAVYLSRVDMHSAVVSSALLAAAPGVAGLAGYADSGHLTRDAHHAVRRAVWSGLTTGQRQDAQRATRRRAAELGVASLHELAGPEISSAADLSALVELAAAEPGPEVVPYWGEVGGVALAHELGAVGAAGDVFADGSLGSRTACLSSPYADDPGNSGHAYLDADTVARHVEDCTRAGLQAGFHAIGDVAVRTVVAGFAAAAQAVGLPAFRAAGHRIEHVELIDAAVAAELARLGVVASVQPLFDALWGGAAGMYAQRLGVPRSLASNPFGTLVAAGVPLALGSDVPVTPLGPWEAVRAAVWHHAPAERLDVTTAFTAHTRGGWQAAAAPDDAGTLTPGAPATFAVWDTPTASGLPDLAPDLPLPRCLRTVVRGSTVYEVEGR
jgi:predicted amidohydrolase YtcJ